MLFRSISIFVPASAANAEFAIKDGVLTRYIGAGGDVVIPNNVTVIGSGAFMDCASLKSITIPDSVTKIESAAFCRCTSLESIVIPDSVTSLGLSAFDRCTSLTSVQTGNGITAIGEQAFKDCSSLHNLTIGNSVKSIEKAAFSRCSALTDLVIPDNVTYIGPDAFYHCTALSHLIIPDSTVCDESAFYDCNSIPEYERPGVHVDWDNVEEINGFQISNGALIYYNGSARNITIPDTVTTIRVGAFRDCAQLESITIPSSVQQIGNSAFTGCRNLKRIVFPSTDKVSKSLRHCDFRSLFDSCAALEEIVNCPDESVCQDMNTNERIRAAWVDPTTCITPQSQRIVSISNEICSGKNSDYAKAKAIYDWVSANIEYDYDYYYNRNKSVTTYPEDVLDSKLTICDGYARLTQALLQAQNIPALYVNGKGNTQSHAWNLTFADGRWVYLDTTWSRPRTLDIYTSELTDSGATYDPNWFDPSPLYFSLTHIAEASFIDPNASHYVGADDTPYPAAKTTAVPSKSTVLINGNSVRFEIGRAHV